MAERKVKKTIKDLNKKIKKLEKAFHKMEMRPCKGDEDLKQREIDLRMLRQEIYALEQERDTLVYKWWDKVPK